MSYKVAISIWQNRVSPVMDSARQLMVVDYEDKREVKHMVIDIPNLNLIHKTEFLKSLGINLLICGAISTQMQQVLTASHIEVIPFIRGPMQKVLNAYINGNLNGDNFCLPGCRGNALEPGRRGSLPGMRHSLRRYF